MKLSKDDALLLAVVIAVASPGLPVIGNPTNLAALLMFLVLMSTGSARVRLIFFYLLALILALVSLSTVAGLLAIRGSYTFNPNAFGPFFRIAVCACAIACVADPVSMQRKLLWIGCGASLFAIMQFLSPVVAEFTSVHYLSSERVSVFTEDFSDEAIVRVIGFYENPSSVALICISLILISLYAFSKCQIGRWTVLLFIAVNMTAGLLSMSKIFFAGLPLLLLQLVVLRYGKSATLAVAAAAVAAVALYRLDNPLADLIRYSLSATLDPDLALTGRYLYTQEAVVSRSWLFGYGSVQVGGVMINDSVYLQVLYLLGLFGGSVLVAHLAWWLFVRRRYVPMTLYLLVAVIMIAGIGTNSILGYRIEIILTTMCVLLCVKSQSTVDMGPSRC